MVGRLLNSPSFRRLIAVLAMALAAGCGGDSGSAPAPVSTSTGDPKLYEDSPYLALDGSQDQIVMLNLDLTRRLTFYEKARDAVFHAEERKAWLEDLRKKLGIDPLKDVERMVIALKEPLDFDDPLKNSVIILVCTYGSPETFTKGFVEFINGRYVTTNAEPAKTDYRDIPVYSMAGSASIENPDQTLDYYLAFPTKRIVVFSRQMAMLTPVIDVIKGGAPNLQSKPAWQRRLSGVRFNSVFMALGQIPVSVQDWLKDKVKTDPDYNGLIFLHDGREFYVSFAYTGRDYELSASITCEEISRAQGLRSNIEEFRTRGLDMKAISEWSGTETDRAKVWKKLVDEVTVSISGQAVTLDVKKERGQMDRFVDEVINPPKSGEPATPEKPAESIGSTPSEELDPFK